MVYIKDFVTDFIVTRNDEAVYDVAQCVNQYKRCATTVTVTLEVYGRYVIASAEKSRNPVADSTVPETVVPHTLRHAPVLLARRIRRL